MPLVSLLSHILIVGRQLSPGGCRQVIQLDYSVTQPVSLSVESSSVTSLPARKHILSHAIGKSFKSYFDSWQTIVTRRLSPGSLVWLLTYPTRQAAFQFNSVTSLPERKHLLNHAISKFALTFKG